MNEVSFFAHLTAIRTAPNRRNFLGRVVNVASVACKSGRIVLLDQADLDGCLSGLTISAAESGRAYAKASVKVDGRWRSYLVHRIVMGAAKGQIVDHINGNRLDNRRANLRFVSPAENSFNRSSWGACRFTGVTKAGARFKALISPSGMDIFLGVYDTQEAAAAAYNAAARATYGEHAKLNPVEESGDELANAIAAKRNSISRIEAEIRILQGVKHDRI